jgi:thiol:disulfide interchange protein DsbA
MNITTRIALVALLALPLASAMAAEPVEGKDYFLVDPALPPTDPSRIVVTEFFSYQCPHCYRFAKPFAAWSARLPVDVRAERVAVTLGREQWVPAAQAFYALVALKKLPELDDALFGAIHDDHKLLFTEAAVTDWAVGQGINRAAFQGAYRSFSVLQVQMPRADKMMRAVRLPSVPAILIDGRYLLAISDDGDFNDQLALADSLIKRARSERAPANRK